MEKTEESNLMVQVKEIKDTQDKQCKLLEQHSEILKQQGEKIDKILSIVLTQQEQITIMQGKIENVETMQQKTNERLDNIEKDYQEFKQEVNKRFDKQEEFNVGLVKILNEEFRKRDKTISKQGKTIKNYKQNHH